MEPDDHDLYDFKSKLKNYAKRKKKEKHKTVSLFSSQETEKKVSGFTVRVIMNNPPIEKARSGASKEFFKDMMGRHKRSRIIFNR